MGDNTPSAARTWDCITFYLLRVTATTGYLRSLWSTKLGIWIARLLHGAGEITQEAGIMSGEGMRGGVSGL